MNWSYIKANEVKEVSVEFNKEFIERIIPKMDWSVLCDAANNVFKIRYLFHNYLVII